MFISKAQLALQVLLRNAAILDSQGVRFLWYCLTISWSSIDHKLNRGGEDRRKVLHLFNIPICIWQEIFQLSYCFRHWTSDAISQCLQLFLMIRKTRSVLQKKPVRFSVVLYCYYLSIKLALNILFPFLSPYCMKISDSRLSVRLSTWATGKENVNEIVKVKTIKYKYKYLIFELCHYRKKSQVSGLSQFLHR